MTQQFKRGAEQLASTKENENEESSRKGFFTLPTPYIAIGFAIFSATVTAVDYTLGRIEDNTKDIAVQEERFASLSKEHAAYQTELTIVLVVPITQPITNQSHIPNR